MSQPYLLNGTPKRIVIPRQAGEDGRRDGQTFTFIAMRPTGLEDFMPLCLSQVFGPGHVHRGQCWQESDINVHKLILMVSQGNCIYGRTNKGLHGETNLDQKDHFMRQMLEDVNKLLASVFQPLPLCVRGMKRR